MYVWLCVCHLGNFVRAGLVCFPPMTKDARAWPPGKSSRIAHNIFNWTQQQTFLFQDGTKKVKYRNFVNSFTQNEKQKMFWVKLKKIYPLLLMYYSVNLMIINQNIVSKSNEIMLYYWLKYVLFYSQINKHAHTTLNANKRWNSTCMYAHICHR